MSDSSNSDTESSADGPVIPKTIHPDMQYPVQGARFFHGVNRRTIHKVELEDPFRGMKLFDLTGVKLLPLTEDWVPKEYRPYEGCLFDVLSEPTYEERLASLTIYFKVLATEGDPGRSVGLMYSIMHLWKIAYILAMEELPSPDVVATFEFFLDAGMCAGLMRILEQCLDPKFSVMEYNRLVAYRIMEIFFVATQSDSKRNEYIIRKIIEDKEKSREVFYQYISGGYACVEQVVCCQMLSNFSCYPAGVAFLLSSPRLVGKIGTHLWSSYDLLYSGIRQYEDRKLCYIKQLVYTSLHVVPKKHKYKPLPLRIADLATFVSLCCMGNISASYPDLSSRELMEPCILAIWKEGLLWNIGTVTYGIILNHSKYTELTLEKFFRIMAWACYLEPTRKLILEQLESLPSSRQDNPLAFIRNGYTKSRSFIASLITHSIWMDFDMGCDKVIAGLLCLLKEDEELARELIKLAGDTLFDLAHSNDHVHMAGSSSPLYIKRTIFESIMRFGGLSYYDENIMKVEPKLPEGEKLPGCIEDVKQFCQRNTREEAMTRLEKEKLVQLADEYKSEGNNFFIKANYLTAIECYSKALENCPLSCSERRATYLSNRAECYLKSNQSRKAIRDCNKSLSLSPTNLKTRWRRAQALQNIQLKYPAALDLLIILGKEEEAKKILGEKLYTDLDNQINTLMERGSYAEMAAWTNGPVVYMGTLQRGYAINQDKRENRPQLPPYRGRYFHEIFGYGPGEFS